MRRPGTGPVRVRTAARNQGLVDAATGRQEPAGATAAIGERGAGSGGRRGAGEWRGQ